MKKISLSLVCAIIIFLSMLIRLINDQGKVMAASVVDYSLIITFIIFFVGVFLLGYFTGKDLEN